MFKINILLSFFKSLFLHFGTIINQSPLMYLDLSEVLGLIHFWLGCTEHYIEIGVVVLFLGVYNRWYVSRCHVVGHYTWRELAELNQLTITFYFTFLPLFSFFPLLFPFLSIIRIVISYSVFLFYEYSSVFGILNISLMNTIRYSVFVIFHE